MNIHGKPVIKKLKDIDDAYIKHMAYLNLQSKLEANQENMMRGLPPVIPTPVPDPRTLAQRRADLIEQRAKATQNILKLNIDKGEVNKILQELDDKDILDLNQVFPLLQKEISKFADIDADFFIDFFNKLVENLRGSDYQLGLVQYEPLKTEKIEFDSEMYDYLETSIDNLIEDLRELEEIDNSGELMDQMAEEVENYFNNRNIDNVYFRYIIEYASTKKHSQKQIDLLSKMDKLTDVLQKISDDYDFGTDIDEDEIENMTNSQLETLVSNLSNVDLFIELINTLPNISNKKYRNYFNMLIDKIGVGRSKGFFRTHKQNEMKRRQQRLEEQEDEENKEDEYEGDEYEEDEYEGDEYEEDDEQNEYYQNLGYMPLRGNGIKKFINPNRRKTTPRVIYGSGLGKVEEIPKWMLFGKFTIHYPELKRNILNIRHKSLSQIPDLNKKIKISDDLRDLIEDVLKTGNMSKSGYKNLTEKDKKIFDIITTKADLYERFGIKPVITQPKDMDLEKDMKRFELVKGEWIAGNNNDEVKQELILLISKFIGLKMISEDEGKDILKELLKK